MENFRKFVGVVESDKLVVVGGGKRPAITFDQAIAKIQQLELELELAEQKMFILTQKLIAYGDKTVTYDEVEESGPRIFD